MNSIRKILLTLLSVALMSAFMPARGQQVRSESSGGRSVSSSPAADNLDRYCRTNPFEEIWLHTDRESYVAGETVRIRPWLISYPDLRHKVIDSYVYAELLDFHGNPVAQATVSIVAGRGESQLFLPDSLVTGSYLLRAYTSVMKNYMPYGCFMKKITIANPFREEFVDFFTSLKFRNDPPYEVRFYPEGGRLISGAENVVGISAVNRYGYPTGCRAVLSNATGEVVGDIVVDSTGIGSFELTPEPGETYFITPDGSDRRFALPAAAKSGAGLRVSVDAPDEVTVEMRKNAGDGDSYKAGGHLLIQSRGKILFSRHLAEWKEEYRITIPCNQLAEGINNIALFDGEGAFQSERYIFIPPREEKKLAIAVSGIFSGREFVSIEISDPAAGPLAAGSLHGSISVAAFTSAERPVNASDYLLLGSEFIHEGFSPGSAPLFAGLSADKKNIFLLGIKSNWIDWHAVAGGGWEPPVYSEEKYGRRLTASLNNPPILPDEERLTAFLVSWGLRHSFQYTVSDSSGRFVFFLERKDEPDDIMIRISDPGKAHPLKIESSYCEIKPATLFMADTTPMKSLNGEIGRMTDRYQVRKIYGINDTLSNRREEEGKGVRRRFYGNPDLELVLEDYIALSSMREIFFELVNRIAVRTDRKEGGYILWDQVMKRSPAMFIDQVPVDDAETVLGLDPGHVKQIDIIYGNYLFGDIVFPGILNVLTREGNYSESRLPATGLRTSFTMHDQPVMFISPDYTDPVKKKNRIPDLRNTIYWNGSLESEGSGSITCSLTSPDDAPECRITVNLVNEEGRIISAGKIIRISKE